MTCAKEPSAGHSHARSTGHYSALNVTGSYISIALCHNKDHRPRACPAVFDHHGSIPNRPRSCRKPSENLRLWLMSVHNHPLFKHEIDVTAGFKARQTPSCSFWLGLPPETPPCSVARLISAYRLLYPDTVPAFIDPSGCRQHQSKTAPFPEPPASLILKSSPVAEYPD